MELSLHFNKSLIRGGGGWVLRAELFDEHTGTSWGVYLTYKKLRKHIMNPYVQK